MFDSLTFMELRERFLRLTQREQLMFVLVLSAALYFVFDFLVFQPQKQREQALLDSQSALNAQAVVLSAQVSVADRVINENLEQKQLDYQRLKKQAEQLEAVVASVMPETPRMRGLIGDILGASKSKIKVASIKTLPVKTLFGQAPAPAPANASTASAGGPIYKHGLDIELRGSYLDLMTYMRDLEEVNPKLYWSNASLSSGNYPETIFRVSLFMLSAQSKF